MSWIIFLVLAICKLMDSKYGRTLRQRIYERYNIFRLPKHSFKVNNKTVSFKFLFTYFLILLLTYFASEYCAYSPDAYAAVIAAILICIAVWISFFYEPGDSWISECMNISIVIIMFSAYWSSLLLLFIHLKNNIYPFYAALFVLFVSFSVLYERRVCKLNPMRYFFLWILFCILNVVVIGYSFGIYVTISNENLYAIFLQVNESDVVLAHLKILYAGLYWGLNGNELTQGGRLIECVANDFDYNAAYKLLAWVIMVAGGSMFIYLKPWLSDRRL